MNLPSHRTVLLAGLAALCCGLCVTANSSAATLGLSRGIDSSRSAASFLVYKAAGSITHDAALLNGVRPIRSRGRRLLAMQFKTVVGFEDSPPLDLSRGCGRNPRQAVDRVDDGRGFARVRISLPAPSEQPVSVYCVIQAPAQAQHSAERVRSLWFQAGDNPDYISLQGLPAGMHAVVELGGGVDLFSASGQDTFFPQTASGSRATFAVCADRFWQFTLRSGGEPRDCRGPVPATGPDGRPNTLGLSDHIHGGSGDDKLYGTDGAEGIFGQGGNDLINLGRGNDGAFGGAGNDKLVGGLGDDQLDYGYFELSGPPTDGEDLAFMEQRSLERQGGNDTLLGDEGEDRAGPGAASAVTGTAGQYQFALRHPGSRRVETSVDTATGVEWYLLSAADDQFRNDRGYAITVDAGPGNDRIVVSGNPSPSYRDTVNCGEPFDPAEVDRDTVEIDAPRSRRAGDAEALNTFAWLRDSSIDCENKLLQGGASDEDAPILAP